MGVTTLGCKNCPNSCRHMADVLVNIIDGEGIPCGKNCSPKLRYNGWEMRESTQALFELMPDQLNGVEVRQRRGIIQQWDRIGQKPFLC